MLAAGCTSEAGGEPSSGSASPSTREATESLDPGSPTQDPDLATGDLAELACSLPHEWLLRTWRGNRADAGRLAHGLPKSNKFLRGVE